MFKISRACYNTKNTVIDNADCDHSGPMLYFFLVVKLYFDRFSGVEKNFCSSWLKIKIYHFVSMKGTYSVCNVIWGRTYKIL